MNDQQPVGLYCNVGHSGETNMFSLVEFEKVWEPLIQIVLLPFFNPDLHLSHPSLFFFYCSIFGLLQTATLLLTITKITYLLLWFLLYRPTNHVCCRPLLGTCEKAKQCCRQYCFLLLKISFQPLEGSPSSRLFVLIMSSYFLSSALSPMPHLTPTLTPPSLNLAAAKFADLLGSVRRGSGPISDSEGRSVSPPAAVLSAPSPPHTPVVPMQSK